MRDANPRVAAWRLWTLQGSWNRQGLQWLGWAVVLAPWLRRRYPDAAERGRWLQQEPTSSNTNPYVAGLLLGARMRVEEEHGSATARSVSEAMSRTLGALGDGLLWASVRPTLALAAILLAPFGATAAGLGVWVLFCVGQGWLRQRCLNEGYARGIEAVDLLAHPWVHRVQAQWRRAGAAMAGAVAVLMALRADGSDTPWTAVGAALVLGLVAAARRWRPEWVLIAACGLFVAVGRLSVAFGEGWWTWP